MIFVEPTECTNPECDFGEHNVDGYCSLSCKELHKRQRDLEWLTERRENLTIENKRLTSENAKLQNIATRARENADWAYDKQNAAVNEVEKLKAENDALGELLGNLQYQYVPATKMDACICCGHYGRDGCDPDCKIDIAINHGLTSVNAPDCELAECLKDKKLNEKGSGE